MKYKSILFDMDGTLIETSALWEACISSALSQSNIPLNQDEIISLRQSPVRDLLLKKGYSEEDVQKIKALRDAAMTDHLETIVWMTGAEELLSSIKVPMAIITSTSLSMFEIFDNALNISRYFSCVITSDDVRPDYKPHPKGLLMACAALHVSPEECVYIGDQITDLQVAEAAGMASILAHGTYTPADLHQSNEVFALKDIHRYLV